MTEPIPFKPMDPIERKELADGAKELLGNKAFTEATLRLRKQWFEEWKASTDEAQDKVLKARIQALEAIPQQLQIIINDQTMALARKK